MCSTQNYDEINAYKNMVEKGMGETDSARITRTDILKAAHKCVCGDRDEQYGSPENSFRVIAKFWESYIAEKCVSNKAEVFILPEDIAAMMVLFKMARVATGAGKSDNWIDAAGYAACGGEIEGGNNESKN